MAVVAVATANPVKLDAVRRGFERAFGEAPLDVRALDAPSGVADTPRSDLETLRGAEQRAAAARDLCPQADFWVGVEGGVAEGAGALTSFGWVVVRSRDAEGRARSATFELPEAVSARVRRGIGLAQACDEVLGGDARTRGAVGLLTGGAVDRSGLYAQAVTLALIPFLADGAPPPTPR
ncbi:MAG: inosine/xanthosine triphosphatase [Deltaproteobacteria bacterium]|nr:inosine/xanthosine triphosphatase [Deltaproteobacteria bacterium]